LLRDNKKGEHLINTEEEGREGEGKKQIFDPATIEKGRSFLRREVGGGWRGKRQDGTLHWQGAGEEEREGGRGYSF